MGFFVKRASGYALSRHLLNFGSPLAEYNSIQETLEGLKGALSRMKKKVRIGTAIIIAGHLLLGLGSPVIGIHTSAVYAASEFGISISPANGSAFVNTGASLGLSFDRQVIPQAGKITITDVNAETVFTEIAIGSAGLIGNSASYEIKLGSSLKFAPYKTYSVSVPKGLFKDSAGNESAATSWKFTTAPEVNPAIIASSMSPAPNSRVEAASLTELSIRLSGVLTAGEAASGCSHQRITRLYRSLRSGREKLGLPSRVQIPRQR